MTRRKTKSSRLRPEPGQVVYRAATFGSEIDEENRSVPVVIATENPVRSFDFRRGAVVDEVIDMSGLEWPSNNQIPIVDSHDRSTVGNVLGSIRELSVNESGEFVGRAFFSRKPAAVDTFRDIADGHITDFSITAESHEVAYLEEGETTTLRGRSIEGPLKIQRRTRAVDGSVVAVGADENAKVTHAMRAYIEPETLLEELEMSTLREHAIKHGMPEDHEGDVMRWLEENTQRIPEPVAEPEPQPEPVQRQADPEAPKEPEVNEKDIVQRTLEIKSLCERQNVSSEKADAWILEGKTVDQVARAILEEGHQVAEPVGAVQATESADDKFFAAVSGGLAMRCLQSTGINPHAALQRAKGVHGEGEFQYNTGRPDPVAIKRSQSLVDMYDKPAPGVQDFQYAGLTDIAREFCNRAGIQTYNMPKHEVVRRAMSLQPVVRADGAYHTTGSFTNVLLDAANKTLLAAFDEASVTYPLWVRTAPSAADFKDLNRIRFGEVADPEMVPENAPYPEKGVSDGKETYNVEKHGSIFSISFEAVVNDDLGAISRIPQLQGNAMRRKINRSVYAILTDNPNMGDDIALFHATSHGANLDTNALDASALDTGFEVMMTQSGIDTTTILNIMPRFLIVPAALSATALQLVNSTADPTVGGDTTGSSGVANLYGPGGPRRLVPVIEGQLDSDSSTAWYLAADSAQIDTVELTFLQGEESPVLSREEGFDTDNIKYKIRQSFAAAPINFQGLYQGNT